jgi:hypothetical protein
MSERGHDASAIAENLRIFLEACVSGIHKGAAERITAPVSPLASGKWSSPFGIRGPDRRARLYFDPSTKQSLTGSSGKYA